MEDSPASENIVYYKVQAEEMLNDENKTLLVNYRHLTSFQWEDDQFVDRL